MPPDEILYSPWISGRSRPVHRQLPERRHPPPAADAGARLAQGKRRAARRRGSRERAPITLSTPRSRVPVVRPRHRLVREHPARELALAARRDARPARRGSPPRYPAGRSWPRRALFAAIGWRFGAEPTTLLWCGFARGAGRGGADRLRHPAAARHLTQPLLWAGIIAAARGWIPVPLAASVGGAVVGYLSLWTVATLYRMIRGQEGMARRRLQAARRPRRLDGLADDSA